MAEASDRYASAYSRGAQFYASVLDPTLEPVARLIVELSDVRAHERVLDLATGTGAIAREAGRRGAAVCGIDIAADMVAVARTNSPPSITFLTADAESLPFAEDEFDVVTCGFGLSHMPDPAAVIREVGRVLRDRGRFVEASWGSDGRNDAFTAILSELGAATGGRLHAFEGILDEGTWADPSLGAALLSDGGFDVEVVTQPLHGRYESPSAALAWTLAWPDYTETASLLNDWERVAFESRALAAAAEKDMEWWFAINYYVATKSAGAQPD